jgi:hypothetical protein
MMGGGHGVGPGYKLAYRDNHNVCFSVSSFLVSGGGPEMMDTITSAYSPIFGQIKLARRVLDGFTIIGFQNEVLNGVLTLSVDSSSEKKSGGCKVISVNEIVKITNSLDFLENRTQKQESSRIVAKVPVQQALMEDYYPITVFTQNYRFNFPQQSCGDSLPRKMSLNDSKLYPVFFNAADISSFGSIQRFYCRNFTPTINRKMDQSYLIVASFKDRKKAIEFSRIVQGNVENPVN